jgi:hypothetical protein
MKKDLQISSNGSEIFNNIHSNPFAALAIRDSANFEKVDRHLKKFEDHTAVLKKFNNHMGDRFKKVQDQLALLMPSEGKPSNHSIPIKFGELMALAST